MGQKNFNKAYREYFRERCVPKFYNGVVHVFLNIILLVSIVLFSVLKINSLELVDLLTVAVVIIVGNLTVWWLHRYPLHIRYKFFSYPYDIHTKAHHRFYTDKDLLLEESRDLYILFFPPQIVIGFSFIFCPLSYLLLSYVASENTGLLFVMAASGYFLFYEIVHYVCHIPENHFLLKNYWFSSMWLHHKIHHAPELMGKYNFNIVFPFFDYIFGTKYKGVWPLTGQRVEFTEIVKSEPLDRVSK